MDRKTGDRTVGDRAIVGDEQAVSIAQTDVNAPAPAAPGAGATASLQQHPIAHAGDIAHADDKVSDDKVSDVEAAKVEAVSSVAEGLERFIRETGLAAEIAGIAEPVLESLGFRLVRVLISGQDGQTVQIMAERPDGTLTIEECEQISRDLSVLLDTFDPMPTAYRLEISSPGIDRPLVRPRDFEDWVGYDARVELREAVSGRKRWRGILEGFEDGEVRMICEIEGEDGQHVVGFPVSMIAEAKLMLTDDLVREALSNANRERKAAKGRGSAEQPSSPPAHAKPAAKQPNREKAGKPGGKSAAGKAPAKGSAKAQAGPKRDDQT